MPWRLAPERLAVVKKRVRKDGRSWNCETIEKLLDVTLHLVQKKNEKL